MSFLRWEGTAYWHVEVRILNGLLPGVFPNIGSNSLVLGWWFTLASSMVLVTKLDVHPLEPKGWRFMTS